MSDPTAPDQGHQAMAASQVEPAVAPQAHAQTRDPLHGKTLEAIVTALAAHYGWEGLAQRIQVGLSEMPVFIIGDVAPTQE